LKILQVITIINIKMSSEEYTLEQLKRMNSTSKWNHRIILPKNDKITYKIYPSGEADMDGRYWRALPSYFKITPNLKRNFNLL
jgi:hypothetical protein